MEPRPPALEVWSLSHRTTREIPPPYPSPASTTWAACVSTLWYSAGTRVSLEGSGQWCWWLGKCWVLTTGPPGNSLSWDSWPKCEHDVSVVSTLTPYMTAQGWVFPEGECESCFFSVSPGPGNGTMSSYWSTNLKPAHVQGKANWTPLLCRRSIRETILQWPGAQWCYIYTEQMTLSVQPRPGAN